jgi:5'-methylthioadenosine phosphorylase
VVQGWIGDVKLDLPGAPRGRPRHPALEINYRANVDVMKRCGVTDLISLSAIGSLREEMAPGHIVAVDQLIDRTHGRAGSFFGPDCRPCVAGRSHVSGCANHLADAAVAGGATLHRGGCYVAIEGPQFSTRAESGMYRAWGADVIGMTAMPEARLAREAELPYAILGMVTDYDAGARARRAWKPPRSLP